MSFVPGRPPSTTPNYGWPIPGGLEPSDYVTDTKALADAIDAELKRIENLVNPSAPELTVVEPNSIDGTVDVETTFTLTGSFPDDIADKVVCFMDQYDSRYNAWGLAKLDDHTLTATMNFAGNDPGVGSVLVCFQTSYDPYTNSVPMTIT